MCFCLAIIDSFILYRSLCYWMSLLQCPAKNCCQRHQEESDAQPGKSPVSPDSHTEPSHHCSITAAALSCCFFIPCSFCLSPSLLSLFPFVASHLRSLVCAPVVFFSSFPFPLSPPPLPPLYDPGRDSCKYRTPPLHLHLFLFGWVGEPTVSQAVPENICAPWWRRGKWKRDTHGSCIMRTGYRVPRWWPCKAGRYRQ